ncbi:MAG: radical SAM protein [Planctomycetota bacterium]
MTVLTTGLDRGLDRTVRVTGRWKRAAGRFGAPLRRAAGAVDFVARGSYYVWRNRKYLTPIKVANIGLVNLELALKRERVFGLPYDVKIEPTNICNTRCQLCPTGIGLKGRRKGRMDFETFRKLIDAWKWRLFKVDLSMWGDPLVAPDIYKMIRYTHDRGIWTYISSNLHAFKIERRKQKDGTLEDKDDATKIIESGLDMMTCSLHGASQDTFQIYQPGKDFGSTLDKVRHLVETKKRLKSLTPVIQLNFVVTKHNEHEIDRFRALAEELDCRPVFSTASVNMRFQDRDKKLVSLGLSPELKAKKVRDHLDAWLPQDDNYVLPQYQEIRKTGEVRGERYNGDKPIACDWPWRQTVVNWDGQVVTCCGSFEPEFDMGSAFETSFRKVWNNEKYRLARRSFKKKLTEDQKQDNPCAECPGFML